MGQSEGTQYWSQIEAWGNLRGHSIGHRLKHMGQSEGTQYRSQVEAHGAI